MKTASRVRQHDRDDTNSSKSFTSSVMSAAASFWEAAVLWVRVEHALEVTVECPQPIKLFYKRHLAPSVRSALVFGGLR
jgi:hypothetical protein